jgi:antibiotic biosynthesis monooxygenase (ABM) superfamily enzyme
VSPSWERVVLTWDQHYIVVDIHDVIARDDVVYDKQGQNVVVVCRVHDLMASILMEYAALPHGGKVTDSWAACIATSCCSHW